MRDWGQPKNSVSAYQWNYLVHLPSIITSIPQLGIAGIGFRDMSMVSFR